MTDFANRAVTTPIADTVAAMTSHQQCIEMVLTAAEEGAVHTCVHRRPMVLVHRREDAGFGGSTVFRVHPIATPIRWAVWKLRGHR